MITAVVTMITAAVATIRTAVAANPFYFIKKGSTGIKPVFNPDSMLSEYPSPPGAEGAPWHTRAFNRARRPPKRKMRGSRVSDGPFVRPASQALAAQDADQRTLPAKFPVRREHIQQAQRPPEAAKVSFFFLIKKRPKTPLAFVIQEAQIFGSASSDGGKGVLSTNAQVRRSLAPFTFNNGFYLKQHILYEDLWAFPNIFFVS
jgi:hypothetical protein